MSVRGIEGLSVDEVRAEVRNGGRFVIFLWTVSVVIVSIKQPTIIHFIKSDERAFTKALRPTLFTLLSGWWGVPWGPIYSIESLATNLSGGMDVTSDVLASIAPGEPAA